MEMFMTSSGLERVARQVTGATAPLWPSIALGLLAVFGTIGGALGGQWLAARRDDQRWTREAKREELRWEQERLRERDRFSHEAKLQWREQRREAYVTFISVLNVNLETIIEAAGAIPAIGAVSQETQWEVNASHQAIRDAAAVIEIVSSAPVRAATKSLLAAVREIIRDIRDAVDDTEREDEESTAVQFTQTRAKLMDEIRHELVIDVESR